MASVTFGGDTVTGGAGNQTFVYWPFGGPAVNTIADFGRIYFTGQINAAQEVPTNASTASGAVEASLLRGGAAMQFRAAITGLDFGGQTPATTDNVVGAHFHNAPPGVNSGVVFGFIGAPNSDRDGETSVTAASGVVSGEWDAGEGNNTTLTAQISGLMTNRIYINFHTTAFPGGEIRGQLIRQDDGQDKLDVSRANIGDWETMQVLLNDVAGSAQMTTWFDGQDYTLRLARVTEANLTAADFVFAGSVNERLDGTANVDDVFGAGGDDWLMAFSGNDRVFGGSGNDVMFGNAGADLMLGGEGADTLFGGRDNDTLQGGDGADQLYGDLGDDTLTGGAGADRFVFTRPGLGLDVVTDFRNAEGDRVVIDGGLLESLREVNGNATLLFKDGSVLTLAGASLMSLGGAQDWVVFV